ncbi:MFS transporter, partial [Gammaproteobacteria bacterium]|nr:MFS transporter [Gammaproteobacteria bacterium]
MNAKSISICFLGFASGLPYMLVYSTLGTWLATTDLDITTIGFFAWVTWVYALKFVWAPLIDQHPIPFFRNFGNRKSWIALMQICIIITLILISLVNPSDNLMLFAFFAFLIAFFGSIQDIAIDAFRIELAELDEQGNLVASYQLGWRISILVATTGALLLAARTSWGLVYQIMSVLMFVGVIGLFLIPENKNSSLRKLTLLGSIWEPLKDLFNRFGLYASLLILGIISTYRLTDIITGFITNPFYIEMGYTLDEIALVVKTVALF